MRHPFRLLIVVFVTCIAASFPAAAAADPYRPRQWGLDRIQAEQAWNGGTGSGVTIAIVDTGIDLTHPDLKGKIASSFSCLDGVCSSGGDDDHGHGSHVAGISAAATANGVGISGVAPAAKLMAVKALSANGSGACSDIETGIRWAADHGARVINLSLGPEIFSNPLGVLCIGGLEDAAAHAWNQGSVVVIAAGNDGLLSLYSSENLLVVGATGPDDAPAPYSNGGANIYAPGGDRGSAACRPATCVFSTWKDGAYASSEGTSMAAPHVSAVAAMLLARGYTKSEVIARIRSTADNVNGIRRLNAARAVGAGTSSGTKPSPSGSGPASRPRSSSGAGSAGGTSAAPNATASPVPSSTDPATVRPAGTPTVADDTRRPEASPVKGDGSTGSGPLIAIVVAGGALGLLGGGFLAVRRRRSPAPRTISDSARAASQSRSSAATRTGRYRRRP